MKKTLKYSAVILITLLIGFAIGFMVNGRMTKAKIKRWKSVNTEQGFNREFIRLINPTPEQKEEIEPVLKKYGDLNKALMIQQKTEKKDLFLELQQELKPFLTTEQIERMERAKKRRFDRNNKDRSKKRRSDTGRKKGREN